MEQKRSALFDIKFEDGKYYYKEGEGGRWNYVPDELLFESVCGGLVRMNLSEVRDLADRLDKGDISVDSFLESLLAEVDDNNYQMVDSDEDYQIDNLSELDLIGRGLFRAFTSQASRWRALIGDIEESNTEKYLGKYVAKKFDADFARWLSNNGEWDVDVFFREVMAYVKKMLAEQIVEVVKTLKKFSENKVNWLRLMEYLRDKLNEIDSLLESYIEEWVSQEFQRKFDEWRGA